MIELKNITKAYGGINVVNSIDLFVPEGELLVLLGESGCGKTTTLKMINRLIQPTSGEVKIDGKSNLDLPPSELRREIGYCFQKIGLFPHMTVANNIAITLGLLGWEKAKQKERVIELLELTELDPKIFYHRYPKELSGGQAQRVAVARALSAHPKVILFDEPFGKLDPLNRSHLQKEIQKILKKSIQGVAKKLHNTESVCKSNYLDPELIKFFTLDHRGFLNHFHTKNKEELYKKYVSFLDNL